MKTGLKITLISSAAIIIILISIAHTIFLSKGLAPFAYFLFREISVILITGTLSTYHVIRSLKDKKNFAIYLFIACLFAAVAATHILKLIFQGSFDFGGLIC